MRVYTRPHAPRCTAVHRGAQPQIFHYPKRVLKTKTRNTQTYLTYHIHTTMHCGAQLQMFHYSSCSSQNQMRNPPVHFHAIRQSTCTQYASPLARNYASIHIHTTMHHNYASRATLLERAQPQMFHFSSQSSTLQKRAMRKTYMYAASTQLNSVVHNRRCFTTPVRVLLSSQK